MAALQADSQLFKPLGGDQFRTKLKTSQVLRKNNYNHYAQSAQRYDQNDDGSYYHDDSGAYNGNDGRYYPDDSGKYVHQDVGYEHLDGPNGPGGSGPVGGGGYKHQEDKYRDSDGK